MGGGGGEREGNGEGEGGTDVRKAAEEEPVLREKAAVEKQDQGRKMQLSELNELTNAANFDMAVATATESSEVATTKPAAETAAADGTKVAASGPEEKTKPGLDPPLLNDSDSQSDDSWDWSIFPSRWALYSSVCTYRRVGSWGVLRGDFRLRACFSLDSSMYSGLGSGNSAPSAAGVVAMFRAVKQ